MTRLHSDSQLPSADRDSLGYLRAALNRHDDGGDRVMFKEPDSLADHEWPPVELVLDHYEACLGGGPLDDDGVQRLRGSATSKLNCNSVYGGCCIRSRLLMADLIPSWSTARGSVELTSVDTSSSGAIERGIAAFARG